MTLEQALQPLRKAEAELRAKGVIHAGVFGSVARGEQGADSDIDIIIDFDPAALITIFDYAGVKDDIAGLFEHPVDVIDHRGLKPELRKPVSHDLVYAF
jgi:predicted nucleotidyltransferase